MPKRDDPRCNHGRTGVIVTNQPGEFDSTRNHASTWVCTDPACVMDAVAWVMRVTGDPAWWRIGVTGQWHNETYVGVPGD